MRTWLFSKLSPLASYLAVAILAVVTWVFIILPLWRQCRPRLVLLSKNKLLLRRSATACVVLLVFALGLWTGWHKDMVFAQLWRGHSKLAGAPPPPSPSLAAFTPAVPSPEAMTPPSLDAALYKDVGGNPEGSLIGISDVKSTKTPDPDSETHLALQIRIKSSPAQPSTIRR
jgi:hypothetical protein